MDTAVISRCQRCGTIIRNNRARCPSCGLDMRPTAEVSPGIPQAGAGMETAITAAPEKRVLCPSCMASVPENQLVEYEGSRICGACAEKMKEKAAKKSEPAGP